MHLALLIVAIWLGALALLFGWRVFVTRPTREQRAAIADVEARMHERETSTPTSDRFPSVYIGPDTTFGLKSGAACRITAHKMGSMARFVTTDGRAWFAPNLQVVSRRQALAGLARAPAARGAMMAVALPQHMVAMHKANRIRFERAEIKHAVGSGEMTVREAAEHRACASAKLGDVLAYQRRWGGVRSRRVLHEVGASEFTVCRNLTERQLDALDRALA